MKRKLLIFFLLVCLLLAGCGKKDFEDAKSAAEAFNVEATRVNELIVPYNDAVQNVMEANSAVISAINQAQEVINKGEEPYDANSLIALKEAMSAAQMAIVPNPDVLPVFKLLSASEDMKSKELKALTKTATEELEKLKSFILPEVPVLPDYSDYLTNLANTQEAYEDSIQSLKQVTAPTDEFVMSRLQRVDTIAAMAPVTEDHDPNNQLNKQGGYIGCIYFTDLQVDRTRLYVGPDEDINDVVDVGTDGGGAIEIFANVEDAVARDTYIDNIVKSGSIARPGSHVVVGTILVRTSDHLTGTQQKVLTEKIINALITIDK